MANGSASVNLNIPLAWSTYVTQSNLGLEVVPAVLFDTVVMHPVGSPANLGGAELRFFQSTGVPANLSNMKASGMLPNPEAFLIQTIRVFYRIRRSPSPNQVDFIIDMANTGMCYLDIGNKQYGPWPLWMLAAGNQFRNAWAMSATTNYYGQIHGDLYPLFPNLMLSPLQKFIFRIVIPEQSGANENPPVLPNEPPEQTGVQVMFDGQLARSIQ